MFCGVVGKKFEEPTLEVLEICSRGWRAVFGCKDAKVQSTAVVMAAREGFRCARHPHQRSRAFCYGDQQSSRRRCHSRVPLLCVAVTRTR